MDDSDSPAFPTPSPNGDLYSGLTKREWMVGTILNGLLSSGSEVALNGNKGISIDHMAVQIADAAFGAMSVIPIPPRTNNER